MKKYLWIAVALIVVISVLALRGWDKDPADKAEDTTIADATTDTTGTTNDTTAPVGTTEVTESRTDAPDTTASPETTETEESTTASETTEAPETTVAPETTEAPETTTAPETTKTPETTKAEPEETTAAILEINESTAVLIAKDYLGERDPDTGYAYSYQFVETTAEGNFKIRVSWYLEEDDRYSTCGYLIVTPKGEVTKFDW